MSDITNKLMSPVELTEAELDAVAGGLQTGVEINKTLSREPSIRIADVFETQMLLNRLSHLSEMSTSIISASNSAISSLARNIKS
jgi:hypothetical protein